MIQVPIEVDLPGDYNDDNRVDAADYAVWRKNLVRNTALPNDSTPGSVIPYDYQVWRANFGISAIVRGDYNDDGTVDSADYVVWRKHLNTDATLPNDQTLGVSPQDYVVWRENFGASLGEAGVGGGETQIPEPAAFALAAICVLGLALRMRFRGSMRKA